MKIALKPADIPTTLKHRTGIYELWGECGCLYVGKSTNLHGRIRKHLKHRRDVFLVRTNDHTEHLDQLPISVTKSLLSFYEYSAIDRLDPADNVKRQEITWDYIEGLPMEAKRIIIDRAFNGLPDLFNTLKGGETK